MVKSNKLTYKPNTSTFVSKINFAGIKMEQNLCKWTTLVQPETQPRRGSPHMILPGSPETRGWMAHKPKTDSNTTVKKSP